MNNGKNPLNINHSPEKYKNIFEEAMLPKLMELMPPEKAKRFKTIALTSVINNYNLMSPETDPATVLSSVMEAAKYDLLPDGDESAIACYRNNKRKGIKEAQFMPMVKGIVKCINRSLNIKRFFTGIIYKNETYVYHRSEAGEEVFRHTPDLLSEKKECDAIASYVSISTIEGAKWLEVTPRQKIYVAKSYARPENLKKWDGPSWDEMWTKTSIHRLYKRIGAGTVPGLMKHFESEFDVSNAPKTIANGIKAARKVTELPVLEGDLDQLADPRGNFPEENVSDQEFTAQSQGLEW